MAGSGSTNSGWTEHQIPPENTVRKPLRFVKNSTKGVGTDARDIYIYKSMISILKPFPVMVCCERCLRFDSLKSKIWCLIIFSRIKYM